MNKAAAIALAIYLGGFVVCFIISVPLIAWALYYTDKEEGAAPEKKNVARDVAVILLVALVFSVFWVLVIPLYVLMLAEKITGRKEDD